MKLLLHTCCAPCSAAVIEWFLNNGIRPTLFFFNPNIFPREEYEKRKAELTRYALAQGLEVVDGDYHHELWLKEISGLENEPERGRRCLQCFKVRLLATAKLARERGFRQFATTLGSSRWKNLEQINEAGQWAIQQINDRHCGLDPQSPDKCVALFQGIAGQARNDEQLTFLEKNWRKDGLQERRKALLAENKFYNQTYCGCEFSMKK